MKSSVDNDRGGRLAAATQAPGHGVAAVVTALTGWLILYGVAAAATAGTDGPTVMVRSGLFLLLPVAGVVGAVAAAHRAVGTARLFWSAVAACAGLWCAGHLGADLTAAVPSLGWPGWWVRVCEMVAFLPAMAAAVLIADRPTLPQGLRGLLDVVVIGAASSYFGYQGALRPALSAHAPGTVVVDAVYPLLGAMCSVVAVSLGVGARSRIGVPRLLVTVFLATSAVVYAMSDHFIDAQHCDGHLLLVAWQVPWAAVVLGAWLARHRGDGAAVVRRVPSAWMMVIVVVVYLNVLVVIGQHLISDRPHGGDVAVGSVALLTIVVRGLLANRDLRRAAGDLERARSEQERLAITDGLTGLYNRRFFQEFLTLEAGRSLRRGSPLSLVVADLDYFKRINDEHGHQVGDLVLIEAARRLRASVRDSDVVARYGGEEFVIVLPDTELAAALELTERCRQTLQHTAVDATAARIRSGKPVSMTGSFGVATLWTVADSTVEDLVRAADRALYRAKTTGRNRVCPAGQWDYLTSDPDGGVEGEVDPVADALTRAAELVDADQGPDEHGAAMAQWCVAIADTLGLDPVTRRRCTGTARLHDVGKLAIPRSVLTERGPLSGPKLALMHTHPAHGAGLVALSATLSELGPLIRAHHERFDGTGYPDGLAGPAIPLEARVVAVCDAWAAMRATRAYAAARPAAECRRQLLNGRGTQFDPDIVDTFLALQQRGLVGQLGTAVAARP